MDARLEQRHKALERAQEVRMRKAALKRGWETGNQADVCREVADRLADPRCHDLDSFKIVELLTTIPGIGKTKARMLANAADWVELTHRVGRLTQRQRDLLARVLRQRAGEVEHRVSSAA